MNGSFERRNRGRRVIDDGDPLAVPDEQLTGSVVHRLDRLLGLARRLSQEGGLPACPPLVGSVADLPLQVRHVLRRDGADRRQGIDRVEKRHNLLFIESGLYLAYPTRISPA